MSRNTNQLVLPTAHAGLWTPARRLPAREPWYLLAYVTPQGWWTLWHAHGVVRYLTGEVAARAASEHPEWPAYQIIEIAGWTPKQEA